MLEAVSERGFAGTKRPEIGNLRRRLMNLGLDQDIGMD